MEESKAQHSVAAGVHIDIDDSRVFSQAFTHSTDSVGASDSGSTGSDRDTTHYDDDDFCSSGNAVSHGRLCACLCMRVWVSRRVACVRC